MNFIYCFQSEWLKKKHSLSSWLVIVGAFFTPAIILVATLVRSEKLRGQSISDDFWRSLWSNSWESMALFLLPLGVILTSSLITQLEFKNNTWKQLHTTPQKLTTIFFAKFSVILVMMLQFFVLFNIGIYLSGVVPCLLVKGASYPTAPIPYLFFLKENIKFFIDCLPIIALQYLAGLQFKNFLVPVGGGIMLWILSLVIFNWKFGYLIPYTYCGYNQLRSLGRYNHDSPIHLFALFYFLLFMTLSYFLYLNKKEKG